MKKITLTEEQFRYIMAESIIDSVIMNESVMGDIGNGLLKAGKSVGKFAYKAGRGAYEFTRDKVLRDLRACKTVGDYIKILVWYVSMGYLTIVGAHTVLSRIFPDTKENVIERFDAELSHSGSEVEDSEKTTGMQDMLHDKKVEEVDNLMKYVAELNGRLNLLNLDADNIVTMCEKYNFPLPLLLAQAHIESHFGTTPRAQKTNSVFSVGSYDNGKNVCIYKTKDDSVEGYIKLMLRDYLDGKTVDELLKPGNFVNGFGKRYSSNQNYEKEIRATMNGLIKKYCPTCCDNL